MKESGQLLGFFGFIGVKFLCGLLFEFSAVVGITVGGSDAMEHPGVLQAVGMLVARLAFGFVIQFHQFAIKRSLGTEQVIIGGVSVEAKNVLKSIGCVDSQSILILHDEGCDVE